MSSRPAHEAPLRGRAEALAQNLPPLLARAQHLAAAVILGEHGRRQPGLGEAFWQYRPAVAGDAVRAIDWRRSARSDQHFVQQKEWQAAQTVILWADTAASMRYASRPDLPNKVDRAALLALAVATLLSRAGERVGLNDLPPGRGPRGLVRLARALEARVLEKHREDGEYGQPDAHHIPRHARAVYLSDFFGDLNLLEAALAEAADRGVRGALLQVLDPAEESFPFQGRTIFESMQRNLSFETRKAGDLRERYVERLVARKAAVKALARRVGWQYHCHHTDTPASGALLWLYHGLEARH